MKSILIICIALATLFSANSFAQNKTNKAGDEKAIRYIVQNLYTAWKEANAVKWADYFTDDVDYTVWNGIQFTGREANIKSHQELFDTFYKGTEVRFEIRKIRFLTDEIAAAQLRGRVYKNEKPLDDAPPVVPLMILKKENGKWRIAVFQNTPIIKRGELVVGRTEDKND